MTERNEMPKEIFLEISDLPKRFCANFNATSYTRTDLIPDHTALLKQAREALIIGLIIRNDVHPNDCSSLEIAIAAIDAALKGIENETHIR